MLFNGALVCTPPRTSELCQCVVVALLHLVVCFVPFGVVLCVWLDVGARCSMDASRFVVVVLSVVLFVTVVSASLESAACLVSV